MAQIEGNSPFVFDVRFAIIRLVSGMMRQPWRCNSGRTANIATRIFRLTQRKRAFAVMNARSVRTASRTSSTTYARTAAAVSRRGRSGRPRNGVPGCARRRIHHRPSGCSLNTALTTSPSIRRGFGILRRKSGELPRPSLRGATGSAQSAARRQAPRRSNPACVIPGWCVSTRPQMCNCTSGNLEIPGSMLRIAPE
jgi:hypothetical protein